MAWVKRAEKLYTVAAASIGLTEGAVAARMELRTLMGQFDLFNDQLEAIMAQVMQILGNIPGAVQMLTVPGVEAITVAGFLACQWWRRTKPSRRFTSTTRREAIIR